MPLKKVHEAKSSVLSHTNDEATDYGQGAEYWASVDPTIDGMLGGFAQISPVDIEGSSKFLKWCLKRSKDGQNPGLDRALDCGAGIGRITKYLLQRHFQEVDLVEQDAKFLEHSKKYLGPSAKVGERFCSGLQDFTPQKAHYDVIWAQWVLGHLTDPDFIDFFRRCGEGLKPNGMIIVKENTTSSGHVERDEEDSSVTRPDSLIKSLFDRADLVLLKDLQQLKFPDDLYPVRMYALRPKTEA